jgi:glycosyltransferase involved in cell wall biosynthesis
MRHENTLAVKEEAAGVTILRAKPIFSLSKGFFSIDWIFKSWNTVKINDVIIVNLPQAEGIIPAIFAKIFRKKLVVVYHANVLLRGGIIDKIIERILENINTLTMLLADKVITYTDIYAKSMEAYPKVKNKISSVYPPILFPKSDPETTAKIKQKLTISAKIIIGMAARLAEDKGFEYMIDALPILENYFGQGNVAIAVAGPMQPVGESAYRNKIMRRLQKARDNFIFLGEIDNDHIGSFYKSIDVLAVPSILESFGIVQAEAMMIGVPVVTSNLPGANVPITRTGMGILVTPRNPEELAQAIIKVVANKSYYYKLKDKAKKEFDILKNLNFYKDLFREFEAGLF